MEPMTLGSPVGSPASPTSTGAAASPFLPAYLMGESTSTDDTDDFDVNFQLSPCSYTTPLGRSVGLCAVRRRAAPKDGLSKNRTLRYFKNICEQNDGNVSSYPPCRPDCDPGPLRIGVPTPKQQQRPKDDVEFFINTLSCKVTAGNNTSPIKAHKQVSFTGCPAMSPPHMPHGSMDPRLLLPQANAEKPGGPPTKGLFETLDEAITPAKSPKDDYSSFQQMNESMLTMPEPTRNSSADSWVTVFGFPISAASFVAQQFAQCGTVVDKRAPTKGNWLHLCYQTSYEARKALSLNGKVFPGGIMVGVVPCRDEEVMNGTNGKENLCNRTNQSLNFSRSSDVSQFNNSYGTPSSRHNMSYVGTPVRHTSARPLGHTYRTAQVDCGVLRQGNIPQKSTSIVTKAMEYVFGW